MVCKYLIGCITTDKVEEGERATWVSLEPRIWNTEEEVVEDDEVLPSANPLGDVLAREHGILM